jgi:hypothetical protein
MKPIPVSSTLSEMSRERVKICCEIKYRFSEERDSLFEKVYDAINVMKYNDRLRTAFISDAIVALYLQRVPTILL